MMMMMMIGATGEVRRATARARAREATGATGEATDGGCGWVGVRHSSVPGEVMMICAGAGASACGCGCGRDATGDDGDEGAGATGQAVRDKRERGSTGDGDGCRVMTVMTDDRMTRWLGGCGCKHGCDSGRAGRQRRQVRRCGCVGSGDDR